MSSDTPMGVGLVLFWPALFFLAEGDKKEELANLKGQYDALDQAAIQKRCSALTDEIASDQARTASRHTPGAPAVPPPP